MRCINIYPFMLTFYQWNKTIRTPKTSFPHQKVQKTSDAKLKDVLIHGSRLRYFKSKKYIQPKQRKLLIIQNPLLKTIENEEQQSIRLSLFRNSAIKTKLRSIETETVNNSPKRHIKTENGDHDWSLEEYAHSLLPKKQKDENGLKNERTDKTLSSNVRQLMNRYHSALQKKLKRKVSSRQDINRSVYRKYKSYRAQIAKSSKPRHESNLLEGQKRLNSQNESLTIVQIDRDRMKKNSSQISNYKSLEKSESRCLHNQILQNQESKIYRQLLNNAKLTNGRSKTRLSETRIEPWQY